MAGVFFQVALGVLHFKTPFLKYIYIYPRFSYIPGSLLGHNQIFCLIMTWFYSKQSPSVKEKGELCTADGTKRPENGTSDQKHPSLLPWEFERATVLVRLWGCGIQRNGVKWSRSVGEVQMPMMEYRQELINSKQARILLHFCRLLYSPQLSLRCDRVGGGAHIVLLNSF